MNWPTWEDLILKILPIGVYESISRDMADIFAAAYRQYPPAQESLGSMSLPDIRDLTRDHANDARNYDPHETIHEIQQFITQLNKLIRDLLVAVFVFSAFTGAGFWVSRSRGLLDALGSVSQFLVSVIVGGSTAIGLLAGIVYLYSRVLSFNTFMVRVLNRELVIDGGDLRTRDDEELVGYMIWNSSLNGGAGFKLIAIFSVLWILSALIPRRDPYTYIKTVVEENVGIFGEADGLVDAFSLGIHRIRARRGDGESPSVEELAEQTEDEGASETAVEARDD